MSLGYLTVPAEEAFNNCYLVPTEDYYCEKLGLESRSKQTQAKHSFQSSKPSLIPMDRKRKADFDFGFPFGTTADIDFWLEDLASFEALYPQLRESPAENQAMPFKRHNSGVSEVSSSSSGSCSVNGRSTKTESKGTKFHQKRSKWSKSELFQLWQAIEEFGNEWTEVQKRIGTRTYPQVKDKGRRLLQVESWVTGKTKRDTENAREIAKEIASKVLSTRFSPISPNTALKLDDFDSLQN